MPTPSGDRSERVTRSAGRALRSVRVAAAERSPARCSATTGMTGTGSVPRSSDDGEDHERRHVAPRVELAGAGGAASPSSCDARPSARCRVDASHSGIAGLDRGSATGCLPGEPDSALGAATRRLGTSCGSIACGTPLLTVGSSIAALSTTVPAIRSSQPRWRLSTKIQMSPGRTRAGDRSSPCRRRTPCPPIGRRPVADDPSPIGRMPASARPAQKTGSSTTRRSGGHGRRTTGRPCPRAA